MPVCHGAGGMTAHRTFGARTGGAPILIGGSLVVIAIALGNSLPALLAGFPLPILAGLLAISGLMHIALLKDLRRPSHWLMAIAVGITGFASNLAVALTAAVVIRWMAKAVSTMRGKVADYDHWRQLGLTGWGWDDVLPFFKRHQDHFLAPSDAHAAGGELRIEAPRVRWDLLDAFAVAAEQAGIKRIADFNCGDNE